MSVYEMSLGVGVIGLVYAGILSGEKPMKPAWATVVCVAALPVAGTPTPGGPAAVTVGALAPVACPIGGFPPRLRSGRTCAPAGTFDCASCGLCVTAAALFAGA